MYDTIESIKRFVSYASLISSIAILFAYAAFAQTSPVVLGNSQILSSLDSNDSGMAEAFPVTANATGQINSLWVFLDSSNTAQSVWIALYTSNSGHPRALLTQANITNPVPGMWNTAAVPAIQVRQGARYWLALLGLNGQVRFHDGTSSCYSETSRLRNLQSLPQTWWSGSRWSTCIVSMFAAGARSDAPSVTVTPTSASLHPGQQFQFSATVNGSTNSGVTWTSSGGALTSGGLYTAPSSAGTYTVTATSVADSSISASAQVSVTATNVVSISVTPTVAGVQANSQQQFTALVSGTSNTAVTWSASGGTINTSGLYTSPSSAGTYSVVAVSAADTTKSASAVISVTASPVISVSISPSSVSMPEKWQQQFSATVSGSTNRAVTWAVIQGAGTISSTGTFIAPPTVETDVVAATSQADGTTSASATINIVPPHSVSLNWNASSSSDVISYNVYRGTTTGGPYTEIQGGLASVSYTDSSVQPGAVYYYVTTAVDANQTESEHSNEVQASIPLP